MYIEEINYEFENKHKCVSLGIARSLGKNMSNLSDNLRKLSTGERVTRAGDDAAGLAISENLKAYIRGTRQAEETRGCYFPGSDGRRWFK